MDNEQKTSRFLTGEKPVTPLGTTGGSMFLASTKVNGQEKETPVIIMDASSLPLSDRTLAVFSPPPSNNSVAPLKIDGLSHDQMVEFVNMRESWRTMDTKYADMTGLDGTAVKNINFGDYKTLVANQDTLKASSNLCKAETLADLGALGDMIRLGGASPEVIDNIIKWRQNAPHDISHMSPPVLEALKSRIDEMGVEGFRKLDDKQSRDLYFELTDKHGMSPRTLEIIAKYENADSFKKHAFHIDAATNPDIRRALEFRQYLLKETTENPSNTNLKPGENNDIGSWNPLRLMEDKAFALGNKVTPVTMFQAYDTLQTELREQMKKDPDNHDVYAEKITRLKTTFVEDIKNIEYTSVNARYGVKYVRNDAPKM